MKQMWLTWEAYSTGSAGIRAGVLVGCASGRLEAGAPGSAAPRCMWLSLLLLLLELTIQASGADKVLALQGRNGRIEVRVTEGRTAELYLAKNGGAWVQVATCDPAGKMGPVAAPDPSLDGPMISIEEVAVAGNRLVQRFRWGRHRLVRILEWVDGGPWIRVTSRLEPSAPLQLHGFADHYRFVPRPDWCFSPSVGGFNPDAQYKAPLILTQSGSVALGVVPDLAKLDRATLQRCNHALDLDVPAGPLLAVGFMPARRVRHSVFALDSARQWRLAQPLENCYYLFVTATAVPGRAFGEAVRFHWDHFGRPAQAQAADQQAGTDPSFKGLALWDQWRPAVWEVLSPQMWLTVPLPDGSTGGGVKMDRWGGSPSVYLASWFNTMRTSYAMGLYARRTQRDDLLQRARQTVELALLAPGRDGAFKCIAVPSADKRSVKWAAGDGRGASTDAGFLGYDMSWTACWLLKWRAAGLPGSERILARCERLAEFFLRRQESDGLLPTRFNEDGSVQKDLSRMVKAETAPVVLFLLDLFAQDPQSEYLAAAKKGLGFLAREVIPARQWYDYETFWSCSPRTISFDERTQQWPANNLALTQAVAAYLQAFRLTRERDYLAEGEALLDYLLLYQQCWTNPLLEQLSSPVMLLGGFTTQNSDAEWSDWRQSQCGNILLDYYRVTGKVEYVERGVAALRAQFPVSPSENWAHEGYGGKAGVSSFHCGTGSGMAGVEMELDFTRDAIVNIAAKRGLGVNGLNLTDCLVSGRRIDFALTSPFHWARPAVVVFHGVSPQRRYQIRVNQVRVGTFEGRQLAQGIAVPVAEKKGLGN